MKYKTIYYGMMFLMIGSCEQESTKSSLILNNFSEIETPCVKGGAPNLFVSKDGTTYLSWVEYLNDSTDALVFSTLENQRWTFPKTIATGTNWFVNWADFPSLVAYPDGGKTLAAHWLQKSDQGTYDYDVRVAQSHNGGIIWSPSFVIHRDSIAAEHGFVSMLPLNDNNIFATWLDGRNTKAISPSEHDKDHGHGHHGAMTLRTALFDKEGNIFEEEELDNRICDCCQTAAVQIENGIMVAYRDRSEDEIRDISYVRKIDGKWTTPETIGNDNWKIAGCPVNGPSLDAIGKNIAIAWFTMSEEKAKVQVAFSNDNGVSFSKAIRIDEGNTIGRVDIVMNSENEAFVIWLEQKEEEAEIKLAKVNSIGKVEYRHTIIETKSARQSGFPRMVKNGNQIILAWTHVGADTKVKTAILKI